MRSPERLTNDLAKAKHEVVMLQLEVVRQTLTIQRLIKLCDELRQPLNNTRYHDLYVKACEELIKIEEQLE